MRIGIIGAGVSGLSSAKNCLEQGHEVVVFEQTGTFGGVWYYTDKTGFEANGAPIHTAMYKNLKTNLPKETMVLKGLKHPDLDTSYITQPQVLAYLKRYVEKFDLERHIQYDTQVINVEPHEISKWSVQVKNLNDKSLKSYHFDAMIVCNGHYYEPSMPVIEGMEEFEGVQLHSHDFRDAEHYRDKVVLVVGAGPSGIDIARHCAYKAKKVFLSHRKKTAFLVCATGNTCELISKKPELKTIDKGGCTFQDNSKENIDVIIYCTGFKYTYPFLSEKCGITVEKNWVKYVYKHLINIEHPTMAILGLIYGISPFPINDFKVRYFLAHLSGKFTIPEKEVMKSMAIAEVARQQSQGIPQHYAHRSFDNGEALCTEMAKEAGISPVPSVIFKLHQHVKSLMLTQGHFRVLDDESFETIA